MQATHKKTVKSIIGWERVSAIGAGPSKIILHKKFMTIDVMTVDTYEMRPACQWPLERWFLKGVHRYIQSHHRKVNKFVVENEYANHRYVQSGPNLRSVL